MDFSSEYFEEETQETSTSYDMSAFEFEIDLKPHHIEISCDKQKRSEDNLRILAKTGTILDMHIDSSAIFDDYEVHKDTLVMYPSGKVEYIPPVTTHIEDTVSLIETITKRDPELGVVLDFGSGIKRRYCDRFNIQCHVDMHQTLGKCACGAINRTFFDQCVGDYDTFLAINSVQNNGYADQRSLFLKLQHKGCKIIIVQPFRLGRDETDIRYNFINFFPQAEVIKYDHGTIFYYNPKLAIFRMNEVKGKKGEINVNSRGMPAMRQEPGLRAVFLMGIENRKPLVVRHKDGKAVDFLVAGHIKYGETPQAALEREMHEELIDVIPEYEFVGVIEPIENDWELYVYSTTHVRNKNGSYVRPERSRGFVAPLEYSMHTRTVLPRAILLCVNAGLMEFDGDLLYRANQKRRYKEKSAWSKIDKEQLSSYFRVHRNFGDPIVYLGTRVRTGDLITCLGPKISVCKPDKVRLFFGGVEVGTAERQLNGLYLVTVSYARQGSRIWCSSLTDPVTVPVTDQFAGMLSEFLSWNKERTLNYLLLHEGNIKFSDMMRQGARISKDVMTVERVKSNLHYNEPPPPRVLRNVEKGVKQLVRVEKEEIEPGGLNKSYMSQFAFSNDI